MKYRYQITVLSKQSESDHPSDSYPIGQIQITAKQATKMIIQSLEKEGYKTREEELQGVGYQYLFKLNIMGKLFGKGKTKGRYSFGYAQVNTTKLVDIVVQSLDQNGYKGERYKGEK